MSSGQDEEPDIMGYIDKPNKSVYINTCDNVKSLPLGIASDDRRIQDDERIRRKARLWMADLWIYRTGGLAVLTWETSS